MYAGGTVPLHVPLLRRLRACHGTPPKFCRVIVEASAHGRLRQYFRLRAKVSVCEITFVSLSCERLSERDASRVDFVCAIGLQVETGLFWPLLLRSRALCGSVRNAPTRHEVPGTYSELVEEAHAGEA